FEIGIKLDMNKAYDRVERDFLEEVMRRMGFVERWISLVMGCVKSVAFAVIINGQSGRRFKPLR
ncbi:PREDICTED: reverse mRNAase, partial [Prunus dulcis]